MAYFINDYRRGGQRINIPPIQVRLGPDCRPYTYRRVSAQRYDVYSCIADDQPASCRLYKVGTVTGCYDGRQVWFIEFPEGDDEYFYDTRLAATYKLLLGIRKVSE